MLKRLSLVVLVLGVAFMVASPALADISPSMEDVIGPFDLTTGLQKGLSAGQDPVLDGTFPIGDVPTRIGKTAELCNDFRTRSSSSGFVNIWSGVILDGGVVFAYQDMDFACTGPTGTMRVDEVEALTYNLGSDVPIYARAEVWSADFTDPSCPIPGDPLYIGSTFEVTLVGGGFNWVVLPVSTGVYDFPCVDPQYFCAIRFMSVPSPDNLRYITSDDLCVNDGLLPQECIWYLDEPPNHFDWGANFCVDPFLSSYATTDDANECNTGVCGWNYQHCGYEGADLYDFSLPSVSGTRDAIWVQFEAATPCTVLQVDIYSGSLRFGTNGYKISILDDDGGFPGNVIATEDVPGVDYSFLSATFPADQPVLVDIGKYYAQVEPLTLADTVGLVMDDEATCPSGSSCFTGVTGNDGTEIYLCDLYGDPAYEAFVEVLTCCAVPKTEEACLDVEPDVWLTHNHDYQRTGASKMGIGEECGIELVWKYNTRNADMRFNNLTSDGERVYGSDDQSVFCLDLQTGAFLWEYFDPAGVATASGMRNNLTIAGDYVYGSGGTAQSFFKLDKVTGVLVWSRHFNSFGGGTGDWLCAAQRFSVSVEMGDMVFTGDEGGCLWAFESATGLNHPMWAVNPVQLDDAILHSPAWDGGDYLYVATYGGSIYKIEAATGNIVWQYVDPDGAPFSGGCAIDLADPDGPFIYAATDDAGLFDASRVKLDTDGNVIWRGGQAGGLYAPPTIGRQKVYFAQDNPGNGVLIVSKETGASEYNFSLNGVQMVTNPLALTCDNYLFAGTRQGGWYLLDVDDFKVVWKRQFQNLLWGTSLVTHAGVDGVYEGAGTYYDGDDEHYALMACFTDNIEDPAHGAVFCWDLDAPLRPMLSQLKTTKEIPVPFGSGPGNPAAEAEVFENTAGCADLVVSALNVYDLTPAVASMKPKVTQGNPKEAARASDLADDLTPNANRFFADNSAKRAAMGLTADPTDDEIFGAPSADRFTRTKNDRSSMAAGSQVLRTSNVALDTPSPIAGGTSFGFTWDYDGSGLERGISTDFIELVHNDPDFYPEDQAGIFFPGLEVTYIGGCLFEWFEWMWWNGYDAWHLEIVGNFSKLADDAMTNPAGTAFDWGDGFYEAPIYDAAYFLHKIGDDFTYSMMFDFADPVERFFPNPGPLSGVCGIDYIDFEGPTGWSVVVDWFDGGACPPVLNVDYLELLSDVSWVQFVDSITDDGSGVPQSLGTITTQVEITFYDFGTGYGDLKLYHYKLEERNGVEQAGLLAGQMYDWDMEPNSNSNTYALSAEAACVGIWDSTDARVCFGHAVLPGYLSTTASDEVDASAAYRGLAANHNDYTVYATSCPNGRCCVNSDTEWKDCLENYWIGAFYVPTEGTAADKSAIFVWPEFTLPAYGEHHLYAAVFGVDATSNNRATIIEEMEGMAYRVNKIAGFNRGDVNDDNVVDAIDVAYLDAYVNGAPLLVFPYDETIDAFNAGNGDVNTDGVVDAADVTYLFNYLMGGPAPLGEWRFPYMP